MILHFHIFTHPHDLVTTMPVPLHRSFSTFLPQTHTRQVELIVAVDQRRDIALLSLPRPDPSPFRRHALQLKRTGFNPLKSLVSPLARAHLPVRRGFWYYRVEQHDEQPQADQQEQSQHSERSVRLAPHLDAFTQLTHFRILWLDYVFHNVVVFVSSRVPDVKLWRLRKSRGCALQRGEGDVEKVRGFRLPVVGWEGGREPKLCAAVPEVVVCDEVLASDEYELEIEL